MAAEIGRHWRAGKPSVRAGLGLAGVAALGLAGAAVFGLLHVIGGAWHGNPRALGFGVALSTASLWLLAGLAALLRTFVRRSAG